MGEQILKIKKLKQIQNYFNKKWDNYNPDFNNCLFLIIIFLIIVLIISYFIPLLIFGRPFGTDTYTHLFHSLELYPNLDDNSYNYPFGSWLFIATIAKITGFKPVLTSYIFSALYIIAIISAFYVYSDLFLKHREQKIFAILFLISMPVFAISLETFRPSIFVIPFLLFAIYFAYTDNPNYKNTIAIIFLEFIIVMSHTGTFIYLMIFSIVFFLAGCLLLGKFFKSVYFMLASSFFIYWGTVKLFPHLLPQYVAKSSMFLTPGNFIATKFHVFFADDLSYVLYKNMFVNHEFVYAIIWAALFFAYNNNIKKKGNYAFIPANISHSYLLTPFWIGFIQTALAVPGFFRLDSKGKCFMLTLLLTTLLPAWLNESEGISSATGALREIHYLLLIIPIVAVLGFWQISEILKNKKTIGKVIFFLLILTIFSSTLIIPLIGNGYYNNQFSGDDYIIEGMTWLSGTGSASEKVVGLGYRNIPIFTGKMDSTYGLIQGTQTRTFMEILSRVYFRGDENQALNHYSLFGTKYFLLSDKLISNLHGNVENIKIDYNSNLDRIYSSKDFGIYGLFLPSDKTIEIENNDENLLINDMGSNFEINTETYKILLDKYTPTIRYIGNKYQNYLQEGAVSEKATFSFLTNDEKLNPVSFSFNLKNNYDLKMNDNQLIYSTVIKNKNNVDISTAEIRYTFYPETVKREYIISNDHIQIGEKVPILLYFTSEVFSPYLRLIYYNKNEKKEKTIYPSEDCIKLNEVYEKVYVSDGNNGICIDYEDTSPYPDYLYYKGIIAYEYSIIDMKQSEILEPGASAHITQFISIGSEKNAEKRINDQNRVALHLYPEGITPLVFCDYNLESVLAGPGKSEEISIGDNNLKFTKTYGRTKNEITLESLKQYSEKNTPYITAVKVNTPHLDLINEEGLRHPQIAKINGEETKTVLLPVSKPMGRILSYTNNSVELFEDWKNVVRSVSENNDMALFLISQDEAKNAIYSKDFSEFLKYANKLGLCITTPDKIAQHYKLIRNTEYSSIQIIDEITLNITNKNYCPVNGLTFRIKMPVLDKGSYIVDTGNIVKRLSQDNQEIIYLSVDLKPKESKIVNIIPDTERKKIRVEIPKYPAEGEIKIKIKDESGNILKNAAIIIDSVPYYQDENGIVSVFLRRGYHNIKVEKAGYITYNSEIEVVNRIYALKGLLENII